MNSYLMTVEKIDEKIGKKIDGNLDKIGGNPTYMPPDLEEVNDEYYFMEIFNTERIGGKEDILCWQFYQDMEFGGIISKVVAIPLGSELYSENIIKKRRWLDEYYIHYKDIEIYNEEDTYVSMLGGIPMDEGKPDEYILQECEDRNLRYTGIIFEDLCPYNDLNFGSQFYILGMDEEGNLVAI